MSTANLTQLELLGLAQDLNMSDGHPRQSLTPTQQRIVDRMPELFELAARTPLAALERDVQRRYLDLVGQASAPVEAGRVLSACSSSVAIGVLGRCLAATVGTVALVHPTFDNIADILRSWSLRLVPIAEEDIAAGTIGPAARARPGCVFITTPNNPTGRVVDAAALERIARWCREHDAILALDTSFRGFDPAAQYDTYALLDASGAEYVVIEDTGKLWPVLELKLGFIAVGARCRLAVAEAMSDILLTVSPFVLALVGELVDDAAAGGLAELHALIARNRGVLRDGLAGRVDAAVVENGRVSVGLVRLGPGLSAAVAWDQLRARQVSVLPCGPFHWPDPASGDRFLRVALARETSPLRRAVAAIGPTLDELRAAPPRRAPALSGRE